MMSVLALNFPFLQRFPDQPKFTLLEISKTAVDKLAAGRGCRARKIVLLAEQYLQTAPHRIGGDPNTVHTTADHYEIVDPTPLFRFCHICRHKSYAALCRRIRQNSL